VRYRDSLLCLKWFGIDKAFAVCREREETIQANGKTISVTPAFKFLLTKVFSEVVKEAGRELR